MKAEELFLKISGEYGGHFKRNDKKSNKQILVNDNNISLIFSNKGVEESILPSFGNVKNGVSSDNTDLTVYCVETGKMGTGKSTFSSLSGNINIGDIPFIQQGGFYVTLGRENGALSILNRESAEAFFLIDDINKLSYYEKGSPLKNILQWWFDTDNSSMLHSGAVGVGNKCLLLSGVGGSGKSTTAVSCFENGLDYYGDDYVVVSGRKDYFVSGIYNSVKLTDHSIKMFPTVGNKIVNPDFPKGEKGVVLSVKNSGIASRGRVKLKGILFPEIHNNVNSYCERISAVEGFKSLAPSTIFQHVGKRKKILKFIATLTKELPCYRIFTGTDPSNIALTVKEIIKGGCN